jgi:hypothetical protein
MGRIVFDIAAQQFRLVLKKGETATFRHRFIIKTDGFATDEEIQNFYNDFCNGK